MYKLNKLLVMVVLVGVTTISVGCYSSKMRMRPSTPPMLYPSLQYKPLNDPTWQDTYLRTADLPLSFALDTALLPLDVGAMLIFPKDN